MGKRLGLDGERWEGIIKSGHEFKFLHLVATSEASLTACFSQQPSNDQSRCWGNKKESFNYSDFVRWPSELSHLIHRNANTVGAQMNKEKRVKKRNNNFPLFNIKANVQLIIQPMRMTLHRQKRDVNRRNCECH